MKLIGVQVVIASVILERKSQNNLHLPNAQTIEGSNVSHLLLFKSLLINLSLFLL